VLILSGRELMVWRLILLVLVEHDVVDVLAVVAQAGGLAADPAGTGRARRRRCTGGLAADPAGTGRARRRRCTGGLGSASWWSCG